MATEAYKQKLSSLIESMIKEGASDLHVSENRKPTVRVSGFLVPLVKESEFTKESTLGILKEMLSKENYELFEKEREVDFSYDYAGKVRFRGNAFLQQGSVSIALRLIPNVIKSVAELNLPPLLETFTQRQQGFFLVVGPIGHGKTTTLAAMIELINLSRPEHILTIEDPIEYVYEQKQSIIDQREVRVDTPDFQDALSGMFRQDVDVLLIGEMRDPETISAAVTAAETGHLVFSTLHTNNASQTVDRILDSFPPSQQSQIRVQLASSLSGIFSQRLIPRISGGLIPSYELLIANNAVSNLIREGRTHEIDTVIETGLDQGMISLNRSLTDLVRAGEITAENARLYSQSPKTLDRMI
ncbi:MAG: type IV pili twitching motility protein PilT [Parcubacteria group bacterium CG11_big_fil_rev_8_21_14_0_20_39_22]|nr:MAG: type IV pili twitching motility protein PilT [Parcubacteria group bacterium CG11_big_fil_rev_8_21_14_0_20_39_22]